MTRRASPSRAAATATLVGLPPRNFSKNLTSTRLPALGGIEVDADTPHGDDVEWLAHGGDALSALSHGARDERFGRGTKHICPNNSSSDPISYRLFPRPRRRMTDGATSSLRRTIRSRPSCSIAPVPCRCTSNWPSTSRTRSIRAASTPATAWRTKSRSPKSSVSRRPTVRQLSATSSTRVSCVRRRGQGTVVTKEKGQSFRQASRVSSTTCRGGKDAHHQGLHNEVMKASDLVKGAFGLCG